MASIVISSGLSPTCSLFQKSPPAAVKPFHSLHSFLSSAFKITTPLAESIKTISENVLDSIADTMFKSVHHRPEDRAPFVQGNFGPVDEIGDAVLVSKIEGKVPVDFPQGVYIRNGTNPLFPDKIHAVSPVGEVAYHWLEGDGMVHATYFDYRNKEEGDDEWCIKCKNKYIEPETFLMEKKKNKILFLPVVQGHPPALFSAIFLNMLRFGKSSRDINSTNVFEHGGKVYTIAKHHLPYEIDPYTLATKGAWDVDGAWDRPFTSHPKGNEEMIRVEFHKLEENHFLTGLQFVERPGSTEEDNGWLVCYVHDETSNVSHVWIIDINKFTEEPVTKIVLPQRVPYGFHGAFICK